MTSQLREVNFHEISVAEISAADFDISIILYVHT